MKTQIETDAILGKLQDKAADKVREFLSEGKSETEAYWLKFRGVGSKTLNQLRGLGIVSNGKELMPLGEKLRNLKGAAKTTLYWMQILTIPELKEAIKDGRLSLKKRGYGAKTFAIHCKLAGVKVKATRAGISRKGIPWKYDPWSGKKLDK